MPVIACVKWGERYGAYYANMLFDMVRRHLPPELPFRFECFTDDPSGLHPGIAARALPGDLTGWWNKLHLFKESVFAADQRVLYFDLDTLITGSLEILLHYSGEFALLRDFYRPEGYGSGVMLWRAGACHSIWSRYEEAGRPMPAGGDQTWLEIAYPSADRLQDYFPELFVSYKTDCHPLPPSQARVVCFHGEPKQDNCDASWVSDIWKPGGISSLQPGKVYPTLQEQRLANLRDAMAKPYPLIQSIPAHDRHAVLIGGGPTLPECVEELRLEPREEYNFFALNRASLWLRKNNITFNAHVLNNATEEDATLALHDGTSCYYAATCQPSVLEKAGKSLIVWQPDADYGSTTGLQAIGLAHLMGYRRFHLYGFDSCMQGSSSHAYAQPMEARNRKFTVELYGRHFLASEWMLRQADDFIRIADILLKEGCSLSIHGDGMLHFLATQAVQANQHKE